MTSSPVTGRHRCLPVGTAAVGSLAAPGAVLVGSRSDREVFVRVSLQSLGNARALSEPVLGRFITPQADRDDDSWHPGRRGLTDLRFVWGGDTAGHGWGINPDFGGMKIYETMRQRHPRFFIHSGDTVYAERPIRESVTAEGGQPLRNIVTPEVSKVAKTLDEFRGR